MIDNESQMANNSDAFFGGWLRLQRRSLDLTQDELARRVGCAVDTIRKIEAGQRRPSRQMAERMALCLGLHDDEHAAFLAAVRTEQASAPVASGARRWPADQADYDNHVAAARAQTDEVTWGAAWAEGRRWEAIIIVQERTILSRSKHFCS